MCATHRATTFKLTWGFHDGTLEVRASKTVGHWLCKLGALHVTTEDFDKEQQRVWDILCIQPSGFKSFIVVAAKLRYSSLHLIQAATGLTLVWLVGNLLHCKHICINAPASSTAVQQEQRKTSKLVNHSPQPWFVLNAHSIHNYKSILAATSLNIQKPLSLGVDIVTLRKRAVQLIWKEHTDVDIAHPTDTDELTSGSLSLISQAVP